jgi:hypothetical protein
MPTNRQVLSVVESSSPQPSVVEKEAAWFDEIDPDAETSGKAKQGPGVLRYVRLVQGEAQMTSKSSPRRAARN